jgi:MFS family permease
MSSEEKRTWISALVGVVVPAAYLATVLSKVPGADVAKIAYVWPMLTSIAIGIGAGIVLAMVAAMVSPKDPDRTDERDRAINRRGEYVGFYVMSIAAIVPLVLAMADVEQFWIAHALYLAFVLAALASAVVKIVAYRRGW